MHLINKAFIKTESLDNNFKKQLNERQEYVEKLLVEIKEKEREFAEYCRQVEIDRKFLFFFFNLRI